MITTTLLFDFFEEGMFNIFYKRDILLLKKNRSSFHANAPLLMFIAVYLISTPYVCILNRMEGNVYTIVMVFTKSSRRCCKNKSSESIY